MLQQDAQADGDEDDDGEGIHRRPSGESDEREGSRGTGSLAALS